jgi:Domain of unknown function (DUF4440)
LAGKGPALSGNIRDEAPAPSPLIEQQVDQAVQDISPWHEPDRKEKPMSAFLSVHYASLLETFTKTVDAFNNQNFKMLEGLLHPNAVLNRIHHRKDADTVRGRADVIKFLTDKLKANKTQFTPVAPILVSIRTGTVSGTGQWEDPQGANAEKISYSFIFTQDINTNEWSLLNMDAAHQP